MCEKKINIKDVGNSLLRAQLWLQYTFDGNPPTHDPIACVFEYADCTGALCWGYSDIKETIRVYPRHIGYAVETDDALSGGEYVNVCEYEEIDFSFTGVSAPQ